MVRLLTRPTMLTRINIIFITHSENEDGISDYKLVQLI